MIHFGRNPRNGGSPPILNIIIINDIFSVIFIDFILNWLIKIILYLYRFIHIIIIIIEYIIIYIIHSFLYIIAHATNQPIWLIDEYAISFLIDV